MGRWERLGTEIVHFEDVAPPDGSRAFWTTTLLDGPTGCLGKLHAHATVLAPGAGYEPHVDAHDVAIAKFPQMIKGANQSFLIQFFYRFNHSLYGVSSHNLGCA